MFCRAVTFLLRLFSCRRRASPRRKPMRAPPGLGNKIQVLHNKQVGSFGNEKALSDHHSIRESPRSICPATKSEEIKARSAKHPFGPFRPFGTEEVTQYYHRYVVAMLLGPGPGCDIGHRAGAEPGSSSRYRRRALGPRRRSYGRTASPRFLAPDLRKFHRRRRPGRPSTPTGPG